MKNAVVLALDMGTSSVRAMLFDVRGKALPEMEAQVPYAQRTTADGGVEMDAEVLLARTVDCLKQLLRKTEKSVKARLAGVGHLVLLAQPRRCRRGRTGDDARLFLGGHPLAGAGAGAPVEAGRSPVSCADRLRPAHVVLARQAVLAGGDAAGTPGQDEALDVVRGISVPCACSGRPGAAFPWPPGRAYSTRTG